MTPMGKQEEEEGEDYYRLSKKKEEQSYLKEKGNTESGLGRNTLKCRWKLP